MKKVLDNIHDIIIALKNEEEKITLSTKMYDFLFRSNWNCVLDDNLKEYAKTHEVLRADFNKEEGND